MYLTENILIFYVFIRKYLAIHFMVSENMIFTVLLTHCKPKINISYIFLDRYVGIVIIFDWNFLSNNMKKVSQLHIENSETTASTAIVTAIWTNIFFIAILILTLFVLLFIGIVWTVIDQIINTNT